MGVNEWASTGGRCSCQSTTKNGSKAWDIANVDASHMHGQELLHKIRLAPLHFQSARTVLTDIHGTHNSTRFKILVQRLRAAKSSDKFYTGTLTRRQNARQLALNIGETTKSNDF